MSGTRLPVEVTSFVGRGGELADVRALLGSGRLVTLTGAGGVGKTRIALRVAEREGADRPVCLVELAEVGDAALVAQTVAAQVGVPDQSGGDVAGALVEHLADSELLLVMDNCEHLVDAVARLVDRLIRSTRRVAVLATSRESLGVVGEVALAVRPLPAPDAARLLTDRAVAVRPDFVVDERNHAAVAALCERLDGIPLAIELAAVRLRSLSVEEIAKRLDDRFRLLTLGRRVGPARHQTLLATIEWSHALCSPEERALWAGAALFQGGFELAAAEAVVGGDGVVDVLAGLVDKSVVIADGGAPTRYTMLETIRDFGVRQLGDGERHRLRRRHRDFYARQVQRFRLEYAAGSPASANARAARERANLRAALDFCVTEPGEARAGMGMAAGLLNSWAAAGPAEGARWLDQLLAADETPSRERAQALCDRAWLPMLREGQSSEGFLDDAERVVDEVGIGNGLEAALIRRSRAALRMAAGDPATAAEMLVGVAAWFEAWAPATEWERTYRRYSLLSCRCALALALGASGDEQRAESLLRELLPVVAEQGHLTQLAVSRWNLGMLRLSSGDLGEAGELGRGSLRIAREIGSEADVIDGLRLLAFVAIARAATGHGAVLLGAADDLDREHASMISTDWETAMCARYRAAAVAALGQEAFDAAHRDGAALSVDEAIALALGEKEVRVPRAGKAEGALTRRQLEVAELVAQGMSNRAIAEALTISVRTAEAHVDHILAALGYTNRAQIAAWVARGHRGD